MSEFNDVQITEQKPKKKDKTLYYVIGFVIILLGFGLYQRWSKGGWTDAATATINEFDEATIDSVLTGEGSLGYALPNDESPAFFTVPQGAYTDEQVIALVEKIGARHSEKVAALAAQLASDSAAVMDLSAVLLLGNQNGGVITEAGIDLWFKALEKWTPIFVGVSSSVASGIADVAAAQIAGINTATECVATTFVKKVAETSDQTDTNYYQVKIKNSSGRGFLGMNKKKSSSETRTSVRTLTRQDVRVVEYIPHCTNWQLDPTQFAGIMEAGTLALESLYAMLSSSLAMAPRAEQFIKAV